jgi:hypothetical protein
MMLGRWAVLILVYALAHGVRAWLRSFQRKQRLEDDDPITLFSEDREE